MMRKKPVNRPTNEPAVFWGLYLDALKGLPRNRVALLLAAASTITGIAVPELFQKGAPLSSYGGEFNSFFSSNPIFAGILLLSLIFSVFSAGTLTLSLSGKKMKSASKDSFSALPRLIGIELAFFSSAILALFLLLFPSLFILGRSTPLSQWIFISGFAIYIPILAILALTREYASFYTLLSRTDFKSSIRLGYALITKKFRESLIFGTIFLLFMILVSLIMEVFTRVFGLLFSDSPLNASALVVMTLLLQILSLTIRKSAWLSFFILINTEKKSAGNAETSQDDEKVIQKEVPEVG